LFLFEIILFNKLKGCPVGQYGPDCSYQCQCANCNRFTGVCDCNGTECYEGKSQVLFFKINNKKKKFQVYIVVRICNRNVCRPPSHHHHHRPQEEI
jgi:hypothetical protein